MSKYLFILVLSLLHGCAETSFEVKAFYEDVQKQVEIPLNAADADLRLQSLEKILEQAVQKEDLIASPQSLDARFFLLLSVISHYQFYYFVSPDEVRCQKMLEYHRRFERWKNVYTQIYGEKAVSNPQSFYSLRALLEDVFSRSQAANIRLQRLLQFWKENPDQYRQFLNRLRCSWEVGGVISESHSSGIEIQFIEDVQRERNGRYLQEFKKNDFRNLDILEGIALKRFSLLDKGVSDESTKKYTPVLLKELQRLFEVIRSLKDQAASDPNALKILEDTKKRLMWFGLEQKLLHNTYVLDKSRFLGRPETAFFFHTHPYEEDRDEPKRPSGQDKLMSFRSGPSLVFDIQKDHISLYCIILGKVEKQLLPQIYATPDYSKQF